MPVKLTKGCWREVPCKREPGLSHDSSAYLAVGEVTEVGVDRGADRIDFSRVIIDSSSVRAWDGPKTGPNPTVRARPDSKHHIATDVNGTPITVILTGANRNDITRLLPLIESIPPSRDAEAVPYASRVGSSPTVHTTSTRWGEQLKISAFGLEPI